MPDLKVCDLCLKGTFQLSIEKCKRIVSESRLDIVIEYTLHELIKHVARIKEEYVFESLQMLEQPKSSEDHVQQALVHQLVLLLHNVYDTLADSKRQWNVVSKCCLSFLELIGRVILIEERVKLRPNRNCRRLVIPLAPLFLKFVELLHYSLLVPCFTFLLVATFLLNPLDYSCKNHFFKDLLSYVLAFSWHVNYLNVFKLNWF